MRREFLLPWRRRCERCSVPRGPFLRLRAVKPPAMFGWFVPRSARDVNVQALSSGGELWNGRRRARTLQDRPLLPRWHRPRERSAVSGRHLQSERHGAGIGRGMPSLSAGAILRNGRAGGALRALWAWLLLCSGVFFASAERQLHRRALRRWLCVPQRFGGAYADGAGCARRLPMPQGSLLSGRFRIRPAVSTRLVHAGRGRRRVRSLSSWTSLPGHRDDSARGVPRVPLLRWQRHLRRAMPSRHLWR